MTYRPGERGMIVVHDEVVVEIDGHRERRRSSRLLSGTPIGDTPMSRAVSLPPAIAVRLVPEDKFAGRGVPMPMLPDNYEPVLCELAIFDIQFRHRTTTIVQIELRG